MAPTDVNRYAPHEGGRAQGTDSGERHLPERQLPGPPREHRHGSRADGECDDLRVGELPRRLPEQQGHHQRAEQGGERAELREPLDHPPFPETLRDGVDARGELEARGVRLRPTADRPYQQHDRAEQHELDEAGLGGEVERDDLFEDPDADRGQRPPSGTRPCGRSRQPPDPAGGYSGPMATRSVDVESVAMRITASADRNPAMVHTAVEIILGLIPVRRERSGLATDARTASPNRVWPSSHHMPSVVSGTATRARSWAPLTVMPAPGCHSPWIGLG